MFKNTFSSTGRIRRLEYCISFFVGIIGLSISGNIRQESYVIFQGCLSFLSLYLICMQSIKRCHDLGLSGFYQLIPFSQFILMFKDGQIGQNKYGHNPKGKVSCQKIKKNNYLNLKVSNIENWLSRLNKEQKMFYSIIIPIILFFIFFIFADSFTDDRAFEMHHSWWIWMFYTLIASVIVYFFQVHRTK